MDAIANKLNETNGKWIKLRDDEFIFNQGYDVIDNAYHLVYGKYVNCHGGFKYEKLHQEYIKNVGELNSICEKLPIKFFVYIGNVIRWLTILYTLNKKKQTNKKLFCSFKRRDTLEIFEHYVFYHDMLTSLYSKDVTELVYDDSLSMISISNYQDTANDDEYETLIESNPNNDSEDNADMLRDQLKTLESYLYEKLWKEE
jgi:hypothetical protein